MLATPDLRDRVAVIGAGAAGLAAAIALLQAGMDVVLLERADVPGGKMRRVDASGAPIDGGPTVFTMRWVLDDLLGASGIALDDLVSLSRASTLARHAWPDGSRLDLFADRDESAEAIGAFAGEAAAGGYRAFCAESAAIYATLRDTFIAAQRPGPIELTRRVGFGRPAALFGMKPFSTLWSALGRHFADPRLRQLFARYATYCGSSPFSAPATLMLVAHVEQEGVWIADEGMHGVAAALADVVRRLGGSVATGAGVASLRKRRDLFVLTLDSGEEVFAGQVVHCGDVSALASGMLGTAPAGLAAVAPRDRSLSALVWTGRGRIRGFAPAHHTVLFSSDYPAEFRALDRERAVPREPTVYLCAPDRTSDGRRVADAADERLYLLINAPADGDRRDLSASETDRWLNTALAQAKACGLTLEPERGSMAVTTPAAWARMFPGSGGAIYGRASHGWMASFRRPGARTAVPGLYQAGGSVHPGPGVPMAAMSGRLAAQALIDDRALTPRSRRGAIAGGMSTA